MTGIVIIEDDDAIRNYLSALIGGSGEFRVLGAFGNAEDAEVYFNDGLSADVSLVLTDLELPGKTGIAFIETYKPLLPQVQFMVLSSFEDTERVFGALKAGASGYILKSTPAQKLLEALDDLRRGGSPMSSQIARKVVTTFQEKALPENPRNELSKREKEVLQLLSKGYAYKEIASSLYLSIETVRTHIRNIYDKLHVHNRSGALRKAGLR